MSAGDLDISRTNAGIWEVDSTPRRLVAPPGGRVSIKNRSTGAAVLLRLYDDANWSNTDPATATNAPAEIVLAPGDQRQFAAGVSIIRARTGVTPTILDVSVDNT